MSLYRREKIWYYDFIINGRRYNKSTGQTTKSKAAQVERSARLRVSAAPKVNLTLSQAIQRGDLDRWRHRKDGEQTISRLQRIADFMGDIPLIDLDQQRLAAVRDWLERTGASAVSLRSAATVNRYMAAVKTLLNMACKEWGVLDRVPYVKMQPERPAARRAISEGEQGAIIAALWSQDQYDVAALVQVLVDTGLRLGEALRLTQAHLRDGCITLSAGETKDGDARAIPMTERVKVVLASRPTVGPMFPMGKWKAARAFKAAVLRSGVDPKGVVLHSLRHTCCTRLVERGAGLSGAGAILGHSAVTMTSRYSHLSTEHLKRTIKLLEVEP